MSVLLFSVLVFAAIAQDNETKPRTLSTEFVLKASTEELAEAALPPEIAEKAKGHKLNRLHLHWIEGYPVRFWEKAKAIEPGFCQRATYYVPMPQQPKGTLTPGKPTRGAQIKMAADCSTATEPFISLNRTSPQKAVELLRWFKEIHRAAGGAGEPKADVECRSEQNSNPCTKGARQVLAELPLEHVSIVEKGGIIDRGEDWRISIQPPNASGLYWQLSIFEWSTDRPRVRISWDVIPPF